MSTPDHQPDSRFQEFLRWQVQSALRRRERFTDRVHRVPPALRMAALLTLAFVLGAAGVVAAEEIESRRRQELLLARVEIRLALASHELEAAEAALAETQALVDGGLADPMRVEEERLRLGERERQLRRLRLRAQEIRVTGREPQLGLTAPRVAGEDLVRKHQQLEQHELHERLEVLSRLLERRRTLAQAGVVDPAEVEGLRHELSQVELAQVALRKRRDLRDRYLAGDLSAREAELQALEEDSRTRQREARETLVLRQRQVARRRQLFDNGLISIHELRQRESELRTAEAEVRLVDLEIELLAEERRRQQEK